ncbi:MAG: M20/M25/M40 family metallo-hydrolase [Isosphaeraceae bacterium]
MADCYKVFTFLLYQSISYEQYCITASLLPKPNFHHIKGCNMRALLAFMLTLYSAVDDSPANNVVKSVRAYREANEVQILEALRDYVAISNVTADGANIRRNAQYLASELKRRGLNAELLERQGVNPVVYADRISIGAKRTLVIYTHYDGQPVRPSEWKVNADLTDPDEQKRPWTPVLYDKPQSEGGKRLGWPAVGSRIDPEWRLYGRSSSDDKGPIVAILSALDALKDAKVEPTSNLRFVFDGEEEDGSPNLADFIKGHADKLKGDIWLIFDGPTHQSRRPQLVFGVRGVVDFEITVYGAVKELHSGHYGNFAPNPALRLSHLLTSMKDERGNVLVKGFEDSVEPLSELEQQAIENLPDFDAQLREEFQFAESEGSPQTYWERLSHPSLNIRGMASSRVGKEATNTVPASATAAIEVRLVKGNDPKQMVNLIVKHIEARGYHVVDEDPDPAARRKYPLIAKVTRGPGYPAARTPMDNPLARQVQGAMRAVTGDSLLLVPSMGGSLTLHVLPDPFVIVPTVNHDNNQHSSDENLRIANLWYAVDVVSVILTMP